MTTYKTGTKRGLRFWSAEPDKPKAMTERQKVTAMLRDLETHAPTWEHPGPIDQFVPASRQAHDS